MSMKDHVTVVAVLRIGSALLGLLAAAVVFVSVVGGGLISGDPEAIRITGVVGTVIGIGLGVLSVPGLVAGIGLLRRWSWARWISLVLAVLDLLLVPIGTLFGIYAIWVLMQDETEALFEPCCKGDQGVAG
jgi:MFS family permease